MMRITFSFFLYLLLACSLTTTNAVALESPKEFKEGLSGSIQTTTSISQHGITWTFASPVQFGQFVNGDYWVVDPGGGVSISNINPGYTLHSDGLRHKNGSQVNPQFGEQGYDSYIYYNGTNNYNVSLNVGVGISPSKPLILHGNQSLVSTISNEVPGVGNVSYVKAAAVLTCLLTTPPSGSFRPSISSPQKVLHNINNVNFSLLKNLPSPIEKPDINAFANMLKMVFLDHVGGWMGRYLRPSESGLDNYIYSVRFAEASLLLHMDYTADQKRDLLVNFIQLGIDLYGYVDVGGGWQPDGGHSSGRKWPILFAGIMLDYAPMKNIGQKSGNYLYLNGYGPGNPPPGYIHFGEDGQTFYVSQSDVDITNGPNWDPDTDTAPNYPYTKTMVGMPEWGIRYSTYPARSDASWKANYRTILSGPSAWAGTVLAARIMNAKTLWNYDAYFDYTDRYMAVTKGESDPFGYSVPGEEVGGRPGWLIGAMWDAYRKMY